MASPDCLMSPRLPSWVFLLLLLLILAPFSLQDATPSPFLGIDLPSGSMKFFGPTFGPRQTYQNDWTPIQGPAETRVFSQQQRESRAQPDQGFFAPQRQGSYQSFVSFNNPSSSYQVTTPSPSAPYKTPYPYYQQPSVPVYHQPSFAPFTVTTSAVSTTPSSVFTTSSFVKEPFISFGSSAVQSGLASLKEQPNIGPSPVETNDEEESTDNPFSFSLFNEGFTLPAFNVFQKAVSTTELPPPPPQEKVENFIPTESLEYHTESVKNAGKATTTENQSIFSVFDSSEDDDSVIDLVDSNNLDIVSEDKSGDRDDVSGEVGDDAELDFGGKLTTLEDIVFSNVSIQEFEAQRKELDDFLAILNEENDYLNSLDSDPELQRSARQTKKPKNLSALIQKALKLVRRVEEIGERKRTIETVRTTESTDGSTRALDEIKDLKEEQRFTELKSLIQNQNSLSNLIKSETSSLRDLLKPKKSSDDGGNLSGARGTVNKISQLLGLSPTRTEKPKTRQSDDDSNMLKALSKLNDISSLLLRENDKTNSRVREIPAEIRIILNDEMSDLREILNSQNQNVARQLDKVLSFGESRSSLGADTEVVILRALAKLNEISGVLLREQEKNEKQTDKALRALPALAEFIQAETAEIKELIAAEGLNDDNEELDELKKSVRQSLANDKLITRAIIKLNDITQLLLKDVNFTTSAVTNKLPAALTALITSETSKIREMIDTQNVAIVDFLKESKNIKEAEKVLSGTDDIKKALSGEGIDERPKSLKQKFLEVLAPIFKKSSADNKDRIRTEEDEIDQLITALTPLIEERNKENEVEERRLAEVEEENEVATAQVEGQKAIVQALLKLTNITRTLLEEKETEKIREEAEEKSKVLLEREKAKEARLRDRERPRESVRGPAEYDFDDYEYADSFEEEYEVKTPRPRTLIERVATSSGSRNLKGNQALLEEFVKLAIERQRWENAAHIHGLIQESLTTTPDPKSEEDSREDDNEEYIDDEYLDSIEVSRNKGPRRKHKDKRKKPKRKRPDSEEEYSDEEYFDYSEEEKEDRKRLFAEDRRKGSSKHGRSKNKRPFSNSRVREYEEYYDEEEYDYSEEEVRPPPPPKRPSRPTRPTRPPRRPRPTKRTTEAPVVEEYPLDEEYYDEDYYSEESIEEEVRKPVVESRRPPPEEPRRPSIPDRRPSILDRRPTPTERRPSILDRRPTFVPKRPSQEERLQDDRRSNRVEVKATTEAIEEITKPTVESSPTEEERSISRAEADQPSEQKLTEEKDKLREALKPAIQAISRPSEKSEKEVEKEQQRNNFLANLANRNSARITAKEEKPTESAPESGTETSTEKKHFFIPQGRRFGRPSSIRPPISVGPKKAPATSPRPRPGPSNRPDRPQRPDRPEKPKRPELPGKPTRPERPEKRTERPEVTTKSAEGTVTTSMDPLKLLESLVKKNEEKVAQRPAEKKNPPKEAAPTKAPAETVRPKTTTPQSPKRSFEDLVRPIATPAKPQQSPKKEAAPPPTPATTPRPKRPRIVGIPTKPSRAEDKSVEVETENEPRRKGPRRKDGRRFGLPRPKADRPDASSREDRRKEANSVEDDRGSRPGPRRPRPNMDPRKGNRKQEKSSERPRPPKPTSPQPQEPFRPTVPQESSAGGSSGERRGNNRAGLPPRNRPPRPTPTQPPGQLIIEEVTSARGPVFNNRPQPQFRPEDRDQDKEEKVVETKELSQGEKLKAKVDRNNLLRLFGKNRPARPGRPNRPEKQKSSPSPQTEQPRPASTPVNPLANLFNIAKEDTDDSRTVVKVTSTSSSSSSSSSSTSSRRTGPRGNRPPGRPGSGELRKKKKKKKKQPQPAGPTANPSLRDLSPQQRLVQKVMETLNQNKDGGSSSRAADSRPTAAAAVGSSNSRKGGASSRESLTEDSRPPERKKKIIFRRKKNPLQRSGRILTSGPGGDGGSKLKQIKVRVRRPHTPPPFPIVY